MDAIARTEAALARAHALKDKGANRTPAEQAELDALLHQMREGKAAMDAEERRAREASLRERTQRAEVVQAALARCLQTFRETLADAAAAGREGLRLAKELDRLEVAGQEHVASHRKALADAYKSADIGV